MNAVANSDLKVTAFKRLRQARWQVSAAISKLEPVVSLEPLHESDAHEGHLCSALVYKKYMSLTSVRDSYQVALKLAQRIVAQIAPSINVEGVAKTLKGIRFVASEGDRAEGTIFADQGNVASMGLPLLDDFVAAMEGLFFPPSQSSNFEWTADIPKAHGFLQQLAELKSLLLFLQYISSPGGRASELATQQILPGDQHQSSLIVVRERLAVRTEINKNGRRFITRWISQDLVPLFLVAFGPCHQLGGFLLDCMAEKAQPAVDHRPSYHRYMWTKWDGKPMGGEGVREVIVAGFNRTIWHVKVGAQIFRQFELWLTKSLLIPIMAGTENTLEAAYLKASSDRHGHSTRTELTSYAVSAETLAQWQMTAEGSSGEDPILVSSWQVLVGSKPVSGLMSAGVHKGARADLPTCDADFLVRRRGGKDRGMLAQAREDQPGRRRSVGESGQEEGRGRPEN